MTDGVRQAHPYFRNRTTEQTLITTTPGASCGVGSARWAFVVTALHEPAGLQCATYDGGVGW